MNKVYPLREPFIRYVNSDSIRHAARAIAGREPAVDQSRTLHDRGTQRGIGGEHAVKTGQMQARSRRFQELAAC